MPSFVHDAPVRLNVECHPSAVTDVEGGRSIDKFCSNGERTKAKRDQSSASHPQFATESAHFLPLSCMKHHELLCGLGKGLRPTPYEASLASGLSKQGESRREKCCYCKTSCLRVRQIVVLSYGQIYIDITINTMQLEYHQRGRNEPTLKGWLYGYGYHNWTGAVAVATMMQSESPLPV